MHPPATRVRLVPPDAWDEDRLVQAARRVPDKLGAVSPGDTVADLLVVGVEPVSGAVCGTSTIIEILPHPRPLTAALVDLAVLVDVGESMDLPWSAKLRRSEAARESLTGFLGKPATGVGDVSVYAYGKDTRIIVGPQPHDALRTLDLPRAEGRARTGRAIDTALAHLAARTRTDRVQAILLLADSVGGEQEFRRAAHRAANLHVPIHTVVYAPATDPLFVEAATLTGGSVQCAIVPLVIEFTHEA